MRHWLVRIIVFSCLWLLILLENDSDERIYPLLLIVCALGFALYFFIPVMRRPIWLYGSLQIVIAALFFLDVSMIWIWILLLYMSVDAIFYLVHRDFLLQIASSLCWFILLSVLNQEWSWGLFCIAGLIIFLSIKLNDDRNEQSEQKYLYEQLLDEYRNLKRLQLENEQVVRLDERTRIAHDIHDSVGHKLTALLMQLEMLTIQEQTEDYRVLKQLAVASLEETRQAVKTLKHEEIVGIASVLQLIRKLEAENHLLVQFTTKQGVLLTKLTNEQSIVLYRSIQEALTNTMKHGSSKDVTVTLGKTAIGDLEWMITNVIVSPAPFVLGFGLTAMKERVEEQKGQLRIYQTEKAFIIEGSMPVEETSRS